MTEHRRGAMLRGACAGGLVVACVVLAASPAAGGVTVNVAGSAYVDYWRLTSVDAEKNALIGLTPEASIKMEVDVTEHLSFSARTCFGCHGFEIDRAHVDFTPDPAFNIQAGRIGVPFGEASVRYDPTSHRSVSKPLIYDMGRMAYSGRNAFNFGVVPQPLLDTGIVVYGTLFPTETLSIYYGAYVVAGMKGENDFDFRVMRTPFFIDNNSEPAGGGRLVFTVASPDSNTLFKDFSFGLSGMYGHYNKASTLAYRGFGVDMSLRVGWLTLRGEAAVMLTDIDPTASGYRYQVIDPFLVKGGFFFEAEHPIGKYLTLLYRFDVLSRKGVPLPDSLAGMTPDSSIMRYTQALQVQLNDTVYAKASYEYWMLSDFPNFHSVHVGFGAAF